MEVSNRPSSLDAEQPRVLDHSLSKIDAFLQEADVAHALPPADNYAAILDIARHDAVAAQIKHQRGLLPDITPKVLVDAFGDRGARVAEAQRLRPVLGELARLESLLPTLEPKRALAVTAMRKTCWRTP